MSQQPYLMLSMTTNAEADLLVLLVWHVTNHSNSHITNYSSHVSDTEELIHIW